MNASGKRATRENVPRPEGELENLFDEGVDALLGLCELYDSGRRHIAAEIASNLRTLFFTNDESKSKDPPISLLRQLGRENAEILDTAKTMAGGDPKIITVPAQGLCFSTSHVSEAGLVMDWRPNLDVFFGFPPLTTPFNEWWTSTILHTDSAEFSRRRIVRNIANLDRGAHVSPQLEKHYALLTRENNFVHESALIEGDYVTNPNRPIPPERMHKVDRRDAGTRIARALVRQIAHETLMTFMSSATTVYLDSLGEQDYGVGPVMFVQAHARRGE